VRERFRAPPLPARRYYAQLLRARDKFPVSESGPLRLAFAWSDTLRPRKSVAQASLAYEAACVLFNLGACEAQIAANTNRDTAAGIEAAGRRFATAAGVFATLRDTLAGQLLGVLPLDLTAEGLTMLTQLNLAQSQVRADGGGVV
jgi:hypothetical protein